MTQAKDHEGEIAEDERKLGQARGAFIVFHGGKTPGSDAAGRTRFAGRKPPCSRQNPRGCGAGQIGTCGRSQPRYRAGVTRRHCLTPSSCASSTMNRAPPPFRGAYSAGRILRWNSRPARVRGPDRARRDERLAYPLLGGRLPEIFPADEAAQEFFAASFGEPAPRRSPAQLRC